MRAALLGILGLSLIVSGCGRVAESRVNPFNWFGGDREERVAATPATPVKPNVTLAAQIKSLSVEPTPSGAIVSTIGVTPTQGFWQPNLVEVGSDSPSTLALEFRLAPPVGEQPVGAVASREVAAGTFLSTQTLAGVTQIVVIGAQNRRSVRRR